MRTLILSCNTGAGHNSCAKALQETFTAHGEVCDVTDALQFISERASQFISNWHTRIYLYAPKLFKAGYQGAENHDSLFREGTGIYKFLTCGADRMYDYIVEGEYDNIICTHVFPALAITEMLERHPSMQIATSFISTDYTCSPSVSDSNLEWYFIPAGSLKDEFVHCGVPAEKLVASGLPAKRAFYERPDKKAAKAALGMDENQRHLLVMCGSMGCGPIRDITELLCENISEDQTVTVVCGSNEELYEKLHKRFDSVPCVHIRAVVPDMPPLMQSADLFLTKPGGLSSTEAAAAGVPMVLIDAVAGCEEHNLDFFLKLGGAVTAETPEELAELALSLLSDEARLTEMSAALAPSDVIPAEKIYAHLLRCANKPEL